MKPIGARLHQLTRYDGDRVGVTDSLIYQSRKSHKLRGPGAIVAKWQEPRSAFGAIIMLTKSVDRTDGAWETIFRQVINPEYRRFQVDAGTCAQTRRHLRRKVSGILLEAGEGMEGVA